MARPIARWLLLAYKCVGGLLFMFRTTLVVVGGIWAVLGVRSGIWAPGFLLTIFVLTFQFAIFYAVSTLMGVMTRSPIVCILAACFTWRVLWGVGTLHIFADATRDADLLPKWVDTTANVTNLALPRYKDLDSLSERLTARGLISQDSDQSKAIDKVFGNVSWVQTVGVTLLYIAILLAIACWWFASKDY